MVGAKAGKELCLSGGISRSYCSFLFFKICLHICSLFCVSGLPSPLQYRNTEWLCWKRPLRSSPTINLHAKSTTKPHPWVPHLDVLSEIVLHLWQWQLDRLLLTSQLISYLSDQKDPLSPCSTTSPHSSKQCPAPAIYSMTSHKLNPIYFYATLSPAKIGLVPPFSSWKGEEQISPSLICSGNYWKSPTETGALACRCGMTYSLTGPDKRRPCFSASLFRHV